MKRSLGIMLLLVVFLPSCGQTPSEFRPLPAALGDLRGVALGFTGLRTLGPNDGLYSAFLNLDNGDIVVLGVFNVNDDGKPVHPTTGDVIDRFTANQNLFSSVSVVIAVEPLGVIGDAGGASAILQGPFIDGIASLSVPAPLFMDQASGSYRVFTPTDGPDTNEGSGAWAVTTDGEASLSLPPLNSVYLYEHFMVINGLPVTMGRFLRDDEPDFFNPWSGSQPPPLFPGEDFLQNDPPGFTFPADLAGATLLLTLEPINNDSILPSQLIILEGTFPGVVTGGETLELTNQTDNFPTGVAVIY